jgi:hypothetical protein
MNNGAEPATKREVTEALHATEERLTGALHNFEERVGELVRSSEERTIEAMRDIQTEMLKAFYGFTSSTQQRLGQLEGTDAAVNARLSTLEARVTDLERRVHFPNFTDPPAQ